jgi:hypothetical protein
VAIIRKFNGMRTASGTDLFIAGDIVSGILVSDIAHSLSGLPRFLAHTDKFYSVAEHSVLCARYAAAKGWDDIAGLCLFHDASEAYIGDIPSPWKGLLPDYVALEKKIQNAIFNHIGLARNDEMMSRVKMVDLAVLDAESAMLFGEAWRDQPMHEDVFRFGLFPVCLSSEDAAALFADKAMESRVKALRTFA